MARLFLEDNFVGLIGGSEVHVFGTAGAQDITVISVAGRITFDPSFNRGGDVIRLTGNANSWSAIQNGSSAVLTDGTTTVVIPVGTVGISLAFADGLQTLKYNLSTGAIELNLVPINGDDDNEEVPNPSEPNEDPQMPPSFSGYTLLIGTDHDDILFGAGAQEFIDGKNGNDELGGGAGDDWISGGAGNDKLYGDSGNDILRGGDGDDTLVGGEGNDTASGGAGNDKLFDDGGDDHLSGGDGNDELYPGSGDDRIHGGSGRDRIYAGSGNDIVDGGADNDELGGDAGDDQLFGGEGNDRLLGAIGDDILDGGPGFNELFSGDGNDIIVLRGIDVASGGTGNDHFILDPLENYGSVTLLDFSASDKLVLEIAGAEGQTMRFSTSGNWLFYDNSAGSQYYAIWGVGEAITQVGGLDDALASGLIAFG